MPEKLAGRLSVCWLSTGGLDKRPACLAIRFVGRASRLSRFFKTSDFGEVSCRHKPPPTEGVMLKDGDRRDACPTSPATVRHNLSTASFRVRMEQAKHLLHAGINGGIDLACQEAFRKHKCKRYESIACSVLPSELTKSNPPPARAPFLPTTSGR